jgi:CRISPR-associated exonuclease Cas4
MVYLALILVVLAVYLLWRARLQRAEAGLPGGQIVYSDTRMWGRVEEPLFAAELGLTGKPDYLIQQEGKLIPVEVKTGRAPAAPYDSHIFQLAAYCLLVEKVYGKRPPYGVIHYSGRDFAVNYTPQLEAALLDQLAELKRDEVRTEVKRSHQDARRCRRCGFRKVCDQSLA